MLSQLQNQLSQGYRLTPADALSLFQSPDIFALGAIAEKTALALHHQNVYYSVNRHINYTNICSIGCTFCHFSCSPQDPAGYVLTPAQVAQLASQAVQAQATEIHIVGGINPDLPYDYYLSIIKEVRQNCPSLHIKAFTAPEIIDLAQKSSQSPSQVLAQLQSQGLNTLPGGGAEILSDKYFAQNCPKKPTPEQWLEVHRAAHALGIPTNATMLFGYQETIQQRIDHLFQLRDLQDQSLTQHQGSFQCFVPLPYIPPRSTTANADPTPSIDALDQLRTIAISRLVLDNIPHIKAFWPMLGLKLTQVALCFGCDDIDGTVTEYRVVKNSDQPITGLTIHQLHRFICQARRQPVLRDGFYNPIPPYNND